MLDYPHCHIPKPGVRDLSRFLFISLILLIFSACSSNGSGDVLQSAVDPVPANSAQIQSTELDPVDNAGQSDPVVLAQQPQAEQAPGLSGVALSENRVPAAGAATAQGQSPALADKRQFAFATDGGVYEPVLRPRTKKTYLINGLASSVPSIGYGFTNLSRKIPGAVLHNYTSFVESSTIIRSQVTRELKAAYRRDPNLEINLIGISFGANIVTLVAADLDRAGVPVNYLATMEGPAMVPIGDNVRVSDNFSCTNLDCFRTRSRLAWGNKKTRYASFKIKASHIPLANHPNVHNRILSQINAPTRDPLVAVQ